MAIRYGAVALIVTMMAVFASGPFASKFVEQWSRHDEEVRSSHIFNSLRQRLPDLLATNDKDAVEAALNRIKDDERILAIGFCDGSGALQFQTKLMPPDFSCQNVERLGAARFSSLYSDGAQLLVGAFPLDLRNTKGHLVLLQDLTFAARRGAEAQTYFTLILTTIVLVSAGLASVTVLAVVRQWVSGLRASTATEQGSQNLRQASADGSSVSQELRRLFLRFDESRNHSVDGDHAKWNAETIQRVMESELASAEVIVVSNREPYIHNYGRNGSFELQMPASGLVAALEPVMRACGGIWIAHGSGSADREAVDENDCIRVPPNHPSYTLRRIWLSEEEQDGYYYGLANEGLWPLCHIAFVRPTFRETDWETYRAVNERFADAVAEEATSDAPIVLVQDYHFALLPLMVRDRLPNATIITFWHIPWPNSETFGIFPWKEECVKGLLGSSILGFHTQFHCNNFIETVDRFIESRIDREQASITLAGHKTFVKPYPISIEWPPAALVGQPPVDVCRTAVRARFGLPRDTSLAVGIERFDYTKGILDRMHAVDSLLTAHPEWKGRFVFLQAAAPTRSKLPAYSGLQEEAQRLAEEINARYRDGSYEPIKLVVRYHEPAEVFELFRAAEICLVASLHDGMNLVAKEFVASRDDEQGVLVLSTFAGASRELSEALMVNPYAPHSMGEAIYRALTMPAAEQRERMHLMREQVCSRNVYRWAGQMLLDASRLRKKQRVLDIAANHQRGTMHHA